MPGKTKEQLEAEIAELQAKMRDMDEQLAARDAALAKTNQDGWLISTPNTLYSGVTAKVKFENGHAFIPATWKDAEAVVNQLVGDFGYKAERMTGQAPATQASKPLGMEALVKEGAR